MAQGYHRRHAAHWRPFRWLGTILLNAHRGEGDAAHTPEQVMWLYGDPLHSEAAEVMSEDEFDRIAALYQS